jgi:hypothetical protein
VAALAIIALVTVLILCLLKKTGPRTAVDAEEEPQE